MGQNTNFYLNDQVAAFVAEKVWKCLAPQVSILIFIYVASYQFLIMDVAGPWVQIHFLQNRLLIKKIKMGTVM